MEDSGVLKYVVGLWEHGGTLETQGGHWVHGGTLRTRGSLGGWDTSLPVSTACECEPLGAESPQCEQTSGQCRCRPGFGGLRCDRCQRGYQEAFPRCSPCHPCFGRWDPALGSLQDRLRRLGMQAQALREGGATHQLSPHRLRALEETLGHVERLLGERSSPGSPLLDGLPGWLDGTRQVGWGEGGPPFCHSQRLETPLPSPKDGVG